MSDSNRFRCWHPLESTLNVTFRPKLEYTSYTALIWVLVWDFSLLSSQFSPLIWWTPGFTGLLVLFRRDYLATQTHARLRKNGEGIAKIWPKISGHQRYRTKSFSPDLKQIVWNRMMLSAKNFRHRRCLRSTPTKASGIFCSFTTQSIKAPIPCLTA